MVALCNRETIYIFMLFLSSFFIPRLISAVGDWIKDVNESRNARVSKKILVLENLISRRVRNSRTHKAKLCCPNKQRLA